MLKDQNQSQQSGNRILPGIQCLAWNGDATMVAICPLNNEIWIFETQGSPDISKWVKICTLKEHFNIISSLDWHPQTNLLLSASTDRGAIIWEQGSGDKKNSFIPQLGVFEEQRANLDASWNITGEKFSVASSSGNVYIGSYDKQNNFWIAHALDEKRPTHKASVVCARFDPLSGRVIASCSLDGNVLVSSCYIKELDKNSSGPFGNVTTFGETLMKIDRNGWMNGIAFSPDCKTLCYVSHDCEVSFEDVSQLSQDGKSKQTTIERLLHKGNPHLSCVFISNDKLIATGFDKIPYLYKLENGKWVQSKILDQGFKKVRQTKISGNSFVDKKVYFNSDFKLSSQVEIKETDTMHANYINQLKTFIKSKDNIQILCTSDINGYMNYWDVQNL